MLVKAGKYYRRRDGDRVGPVKSLAGQYDCYFWYIDNIRYTNDGKVSLTDEHHPHDLMEEVE